MPDLYHQFGSDLVLSASGDLLTADAVTLGTQRVLRRLCTNRGDYIWQLPYGGGLPAMIGTPANAKRIVAVIVAQLRLEAAVAPTPAPTVALTVGTDGTVTAAITYADATTGQTQILTVPGA